MRYSRWLFPVALFLSACFSPPVEAPKTRVDEEDHPYSRLTSKDKVDLLFLVDDSGSMKPKQAELRNRFPDLIKVLNDFGQTTPVSYHIGVVTSDLGAPGLSGCGTNRGGKLQALGAAAPSGCPAPVGKPYIDWDQRPGGTDNLGGHTVDEVFACMAQVGDNGCGFEMQMEAVYRALHDPIPENQGFLRDDAILAVVFVTDEDDCSAPSNGDLFAGSSYGPLNSYRCVQYGLTCDGLFPLPNEPQSFTSCAPATGAQGSKLIDVSKYVDLFTQPRSNGGLKDDPAHDIIVASIAASPAPVYTETSNDNLSCGPTIPCTLVGHSCTLAGFTPPFVGDPAVRLSSVVSSVPQHQLTSICDTDYKQALEGIGKLIYTATKGTCLDAPLPDPAHPDCVVEYEKDGVRTSIPRCDATMSVQPCWHLEAASEQDCPTRVCNPLDQKWQRYQVQIARTQNPPAGTFAAVACSTVAIANENPDEACAGAP